MGKGSLPCHILGEFHQLRSAIALLFSCYLLVRVLMDAAPIATCALLAPFIHHPLKKSPANAQENSGENLPQRGHYTYIHLPFGPFGFFFATHITSLTYQPQNAHSPSLQGARTAFSCYSPAPYTLPPIGRVGSWILDALSCGYSLYS
jgi:hypothetical protein